MSSRSSLFRDRELKAGLFQWTCLLDSFASKTFARFLRPSFRLIINYNKRPGAEPRLNAVTPDVRLCLGLKVRARTRRGPRADLAIVGWHMIAPPMLRRRGVSHHQAFSHQHLSRSVTEGGRSSLTTASVASKYESTKPMIGCVGRRTMSVDRMVKGMGGSCLCRFLLTSQSSASIYSTSRPMGCV